jgi:hypothetical protein
MIFKKHMNIKNICIVFGLALMMCLFCITYAFADVNDNFNAMSDGYIPTLSTDGWNITKSANCDLVKDTVTVQGGALRFTKTKTTSTSNYTATRTNFSVDASDKVVVEVNIKATATKATQSVSMPIIYCGSTPIINSIQSGNSLLIEPYTTGATQAFLVGDFNIVNPKDTNGWYHFKYVMDMQRDRYDIYLNDRLLFLGLSFMNKFDATSIDSITFRAQSTSSTTDGEYWLDDMKVYASNVADNTFDWGYKQGMTDGYWAFSYTDTATNVVSETAIIENGKLKATKSAANTGTVSFMRNAVGQQSGKKLAVMFDVARGSSYSFGYISTMFTMYGKKGTTQKYNVLLNQMLDYSFKYGTKVRNADKTYTSQTIKSLPSPVSGTPVFSNFKYIIDTGKSDGLTTSDTFDLYVDNSSTPKYSTDVYVDGTTGVQDIDYINQYWISMNSAANYQTEPYTMYYDNVRILDLVAPNVTSTLPIDSSTGVSVATSAVVNFDTEMDVASLTTSSVTVVDSLGNSPAYTVALDSVDNKMCTITFAQPLQTSMNYTITVKKDIVKSIYGAVLASDKVFSFTTSDTAGPVVSTVSPVNGQNEVDVNTKVYINFDRDMMDSTFTTSSVMVKDSSNNSASYTVSLDSVNKKQCIITFTQPLQYLKTYTVTAKKNLLQSINGEVLGIDNSFSFTTVDDPAVPGIAESGLFYKNDFDSYSAWATSASMGFATYDYNGWHKSFAIQESSYSNDKYLNILFNGFNYAPGQDVRMYCNVTRGAFSLSNSFVIEARYRLGQAPITTGTNTINMFKMWDGVNVIESPIRITGGYIQTYNGTDYVNSAVAPNANQWFLLKVVVTTDGNFATPDYYDVYLNNALIASQITLPKNITTRNTEVQLGRIESNDFGGLLSIDQFRVYDSATGVTAPYIYNSNPANGDEGIKTDIGQIVLNFNKNVVNCNNSNITFTSLDGKPVDFTVSGSGSIYTLNIIGLLDYNQNYIISINDNVKGTNRVKLSPVTIAFKTERETAPSSTYGGPFKATKIYTSDGNSINFVQDVKTDNFKVMVKFDMDVSQSTLSSGVTLIKNSTGAIIPFTGQYDATNKVYTITPSQQLDKGTKYTLKVAQTVKNSLQSALSKEVVASFMTEIGSFTITQARFTNVWGSEITALNGGKTIKGVVTFVNNNEVSKLGVIVVALIKDNKVIRRTYDIETIPAGGSRTMEAGFDLPTDIQGCKARIYSGNNIYDLLPDGQITEIGGQN